MSRPLVSIIIPVYNAGPYVAESIASAVNQTWPNKEIIIVDDASTDNSYDIVKKYECDWIKVYSLEANGGQSHASNFGYLKSSGSFIKFLDADDIIAVDYLSKMMASVTSEDDLYFSNCASFKGDFDLSSIVPYDFNTGEKMTPVEFLLNPISNMRQGGRWLIPRRIIERGGLWNEKLSLINDFEYFLRLALSSNFIHFVDNAFLYYRHVENSLSSQGSRKAIQSAFLSIKLAGVKFRETEDSERVRQYIANTLQSFLHSFYPRYKDVAKQIEAQIKELGGSDVKFDVGKKMLLVNKYLGWKTAKRLQYLLQKLR